MKNKKKKKDKLREKRRQRREAAERREAAAAATASKPQAVVRKPKAPARDSAPTAPPLPALPEPQNMPLFPWLVSATRTIAELNEIEVRDTLYANFGNITYTAFALKVDRMDLNDYVRERDSLFRITTSCREGLLDEAEMVMRRGVQNEKRWATELAFEWLGNDRQHELSTPLPEGEEPARPEPSKLTIAEQTRLQELQTPKHRKPAKGDPAFVETLDRAGGNVLRVMVENMGDLRAAARKLKVTRRQLIDYVMLRPDLQKSLGDHREQLVDVAEFELYILVRKGVPWVIRFILTTLGRSRGYSRERASRMTQPPGRFNQSRLTRAEVEEMERLCGIIQGKAVSPTPVSPTGEPGPTDAPVTAPPVNPTLVSPTRELGPTVAPVGPPGDPGGEQPQVPRSNTVSQTEIKKPEEPRMAQENQEEVKKPDEPRMAQVNQEEVKKPDEPRMAQVNQEEVKKPEEPRMVQEEIKKSDEPARPYRMDKCGNLLSLEDTRLYDQAVFPNGVPAKPDLAAMGPLQKKEFELIMRRVFGREGAWKICHPNEPYPEGVPRNDDDEYEDE